MDGASDRQGDRQGSLSDPPPASAPAPWRSAATVPLAVFAAVVTLVAIVWPRPSLWLDEAQSVAIARRSLAGIVDGLRADGAPPVYYVLLHVWMAIFGDGDVAVRSLSIVCALTALAVIMVVAGRWLGWRAAVVVALFTGGHPYFVRYATEARMYALVMLEVALGVLALQSWFTNGSRRSLVAVGAIAWLLPLTHYWGISLVVATGACLLAVAAWRHHHADTAWRGAGSAAVASGLGLVGTAVWWPVLRFQSAHTGTPWTTPSSAIDALMVAIHRSVGQTPAAQASATVLGLLALAGLVAAAIRRGPGGAMGRWLAGVLILTLVLSYAVTRITDSAFVARYTMTMFPLQMLLAALGALWLLPRRLVLPVASVVWGVSMVVTVTQVGDLRTRADRFADVLSAEAQADDVIVYCPDQLGPPIARLLDRRHVDLPRQFTYPDFTDPGRVDWIDYRERHAHASSADVASEAVRRAGDHDVWLVLSVTHPPTEAACASLATALRSLRPLETVRIADDPTWPEHDSLVRYSES